MTLQQALHKGKKKSSALLRHGHCVIARRQAAGLPHLSMGLSGWYIVGAALFGNTVELSAADAGKHTVGFKEIADAYIHKHSFGKFSVAQTDRRCQHPAPGEIAAGTDLARQRFAAGVAQMTAQSLARHICQIGIRIYIITGNDARQISGVTEFGAPFFGG